MTRMRRRLRSSTPSASDGRGVIIQCRCIVMVPTIKWSFFCQDPLLSMQVIGGSELCCLTTCNSCLTYNIILLILMWWGFDINLHKESVVLWIKKWLYIVLWNTQQWNCKRLAVASCFCLKLNDNFVSLMWHMFVVL